MSREEMIRTAIRDRVEARGGRLLDPPVEAYSPGTQLELFRSRWRALVAATPWGPLVVEEFGISEHVL
jgi:hypothetical protein